MKENTDISINGDKVIINNTEIYDINSPRNLIGEYNLKNIMFVLGVSEILKLDLNSTLKSISEFKTLPHRLELIGEYDGVIYYDNSIATIPMATIEAVKALKYVDSLIIGGMDRGIDYKGLIDFLNESNISNIICMPKTGHDIAKELKNEKCHIVETLEEAVDVAKKVTTKGKICLLSPAAASYGFFKNFEEKGDIFKKLVQEGKE
jgi:UDP-N-acetylmuramoylalanine--D-glutamate ligase